MVTSILAFLAVENFDKFLIASPMTPEFMNIIIFSNDFSFIYLIKY